MNEYRHPGLTLQTPLAGYQCHKITLPVLAKRAEDAHPVNPLDVPLEYISVHGYLHHNYPTWTVEGSQQFDAVRDLGELKKLVHAADKLQKKYDKLVQSYPTVNAAPAGDRGAHAAAFAHNIGLWVTAVGGLWFRPADEWGRSYNQCSWEYMTDIPNIRHVLHTYYIMHLWPHLKQTGE